MCWGKDRPTNHPNIFAIRWRKPHEQEMGAFIEYASGKIAQFNSSSGVSLKWLSSLPRPIPRFCSRCWRRFTRRRGRPVPAVSRAPPYSSTTPGTPPRNSGRRLRSSHSVGPVSWGREKRGRCFCNDGCFTLMSVSSACVITTFEVTGKGQETL